MTVLGGVFGSSVDASRLVLDILAAQRIYGPGPAKFETGDEAALGASSKTSIAISDRWLLVADARLDNAAELARAIGEKPMQEVGEAGTLIAAWAKWGVDSLERFVGDFAFAVYDRELRRLSLARDATGQRPLFYKAGRGATAFASMPSGLADIFEPSGPNLEVLARHQSNVQHTDRQSFFAGIERVMPGEVVHFTSSRTERRFHWQPSIDFRPRGSGEDYVGAYRQQLDTAVRCRMVGRGVPLGCHLSSGYDSSAVTGTAARLVHRPEELIAFTSAPLNGADAQLIRHRFADESKLAAETARMHGLRHVVIRETAPLFDVIERQTKRMQAPQLSPFNMVWWTEIRRRAADLGIDTLLTADIGNLSLNASGLRMLSSLVEEREWRRWWREARLAVQRSDIRWRGVLMSSFTPWLPERVVTRIRRASLGIPPPAELSFLQPHWRERLRPELDSRTASANPYEDRLRVIRLNDLGVHRKAATADGVEEFDVMSDRRLIEFSLRLPREQLFKDGRPRPLAHAALSDRVPQSVLNLQVRGMQGTDWHLRISQQKAQEVLETISAESVVGELIDLARLRAAIDAWPSGDWNSYPVFRTYRDGVTGALATGIFLSLFHSICGRP